ncbi:alpha/beta hydrolase [Pseudomonas resinovorans]|uniref:alpha/beta fold hydrolase n=1 Tax=Metapseudomonas resinovorans TaxID=53412 RepID=UPI00237FBEEA|nr:alpha/beta hydrolase [Pseudomonas resinovorans]MDE3737010.1 alpha/beta hydrolase [Pseudomonas resinovorans]
MTRPDARPRRLRLPDGRTLAYQLYGASEGRPLYYFHGFPGSRLQAALHHEEALAANVCLVAPDRPGFGWSDYQAGRSILGWAEDVAFMADTFGHRRFGVLGVSCGGPYALACAHQMGERLNYVGLLAGMGPMDIPELRTAQLPALKLMFGLARVHPRLASPLLALDSLLFRHNPERAVKALAGLLAEPDRQLLAAAPEAAGDFAAFLAEAYRQGIRGACTEAALIASPRHFALEEIQVPVHLYQSGLDRHVPAVMGRHLQARLPQAHLRSYPQEGHLSIVINQFPQVLADFSHSKQNEAA